MSSKDFDRELDNYLASFSGCDGGNLAAPYWICGIEWGDKVSEIEGPLEPIAQESCSWDQARRTDKPAPGEKSFEERSITWAYHQKVAKLLLSIHDLRQGKLRADIDLGADRYKNYMRTDLYTSEAGGEAFKLNLYPFCSPSIDSPKAFRDLYQRSEHVRFPFLKEIRKKYKPKFVICTGKTKLREFILAFGFPDKPENFKISVAGGQQRDCYICSDGVSTLIVTPFFGGRYGMNSDKLIIELAYAIVGIENGMGLRS